MLKGALVYNAMPLLGVNSIFSRQTGYWVELPQNLKPL